jgi:putative methyltransferase (TIGR04325 family)
MTCRTYGTIAEVRSTAMTESQEFNVWEGVYSSFAEADATGPGFDGDIWRERSIQAGRKFLTQVVRGKPLDYSLSQRNALLPVVAAMLLARQGRVQILDFGGGPGYGLLVLMDAFANARSRIDYHVVDVENICEAGKELFSDGEAPVFHSDLPSSSEASFDMVHTSSTMQYVEDWRTMVGLLASYKAPYLVFEDVFVGAFSSYVTVQNYYGSRIPHWFFNFGEFVAEVEKNGYNLLLRTPCHVKVLGKYGPLPMANFSAKYRLSNKSNLLFGIKGGTAA